ncbi:hypothetical protein OF376_00920 [Ureaplasma miroungigenitalium]|uniref:methenyltetrahydrofolate cyclohydrolase n=1 Tax=Ureaplasma miroungigenitalium TaxID=1042321 RepID=A0ABT3BMN3_9BACT|nr:hypothetical protein [Ureaplasma miroungigenitalium]MCV3728346.1 hypothetical protein [Ureaplasma miroungigenitalium]MCV3734133.1 hypothetical protein [Ureaplasma miroungigenitalium]
MKRIINDLFIQLNNELKNQKKDHQKVIHIFYDSFFVPRDSLYLRVKEKYAQQLNIPLAFYDLANFTNKADFDKLMKKIHAQNDFLFYELPIRVETRTGLGLWDYLNLDNDIDGLDSFKYLEDKQDQIIYYPATVLAVMTLFKAIQHWFPSRPTLCVLGRSEHLGKYLYTLLKDEFAQAFLIGRNNEQKEAVLQNADCVLACINQAHAYDVRDLKDNSFLIDVTLEEQENKIFGAFKYNPEYQEKHKIHVSPSPGGIGKLTTLCLFLNYFKKITKK